MAMAARMGLTAVASSGQETAAVADRLTTTTWRRCTSSPSSTSSGGGRAGLRGGGLFPATASLSASASANKRSSSSFSCRGVTPPWSNRGAEGRATIARQQLRASPPPRSRSAAAHRNPPSREGNHECGGNRHLWGRLRSSKRGDVSSRRRATWARTTRGSLLQEGATRESMPAPSPLPAEELSLTLPEYDPAKPVPVALDLLVVGSGPAGLAVAQLVSSCGLRVCCVDPSPKAIWPNNYGVWVDEFEAMDLLDCLDHTWPRAVVYLDDGPNHVKNLSRPYGRVNRVRLKSKMMEKCIQNGVTFYKDKVESVEHDDEGSTVVCRNGVQIRSKVVLDATGHSRRLVKYDEPFDPGYQAAYGILAEVDRHPFDVDAMLFMDWRDSHLARDPSMRRRNKQLPTFLYAMPFSDNRIFLALKVAFPRIRNDVRSRIYLWQHDKYCQGMMPIAVLTNRKAILSSLYVVYRYCLIPMGGVLPSIPQRVLGIGGTAGMVHPSTGYMIARTLAAAPDLAQAIIALLAPEKAGRLLSSSAYLSTSLSSTTGSASSSTGSVSSSPLRQTIDAQPEEMELSTDRLAELVWHSIWPTNRKRQRECFCFGMDILLQLNLPSTRSFFDAFFSLTPYYWHGFLSSRLYTKELIIFALQLFRHASTPMRLEIMWRGLPALINLINKVVNMK
ncbi:hypothetical protein CBR_g8999 [Chara braunii]|uniref:lycopene beta-cyclase n=1 Tax=Chara braunii TaxID=69332 RepID=A0A388KNR5_CHABU|nr:hypothetical protein CBR_g8999 [Chara braunii]|eukprot:GBG71583.1 hypothetical protein CBR_g8999 [Chara braunii]